MEIGIIGLGAMGREIARNLAAPGYTVKAWTRSATTVPGVQMVGTPAMALQADIALTMLSDDAAIRSVLLETKALSQAPVNLVHIVASTISVAFAQELVEIHRASRIAYVAAPVLGRPDVAALGQLHVLAAGTLAALETVRPVLNVIGKRIWEMGSEPPTAYAAKIACNMMITMAIEAMAEAVVLTESNGLVRERFFDLILNTLFGSRSYQVYSSNIIQEQYDPGFKASLGLKDLGLAHAAAEQLGRSLPMLEAVRHRMAESVNAGGGDRDWSVMADYTIHSREPGGFLHHVDHIDLHDGSDQEVLGREVTVQGGVATVRALVPARRVR
jgi:3-hydroxyisobutyrate dehydrogenase-like beta-hydroxyacid dehydrogenase